MTASQFLTSKPSTARLPAIQSRSSHRAARRLGGAVCSFHKSSRQEAASAPAVPAAFVSLVAAMPAHAAGAGAELVRPSTSAVQSAVDKAPTLLESTSIDQAVNSVVDVVKAGGGAVKNLAAAAGSGLQYAQQAYDRVAPVVQDAATTASPYVKSALTTAQDVAAPALRAVEPSVKASFGEAQRFLTAQGINPPVLADKAGKAGSAAEGVFNQAKPSLTSSLTSLTSRDPTTLAEYALGAVAFYYIAPPVLKLLFGSLRGYAGEINPAAALDAVAIGGNVVIVDIRTSREKENGGVPDLPFGNRLIEVEYAEIEDRKVRGQLQNVGAIERQVNKRTQILLLDKNGSTSKAIAKELSRKGFRKIRVIQGGFSGWTSSKLQTKMSNTVSAVEILAPVFGTVKKAASSSNGNRTIRNALPTGR
ncbi:MAG: calcium sensing receptor [Trebouxia sp. A1-2]|nr:MAG: calcium sensing receptor [Trebouxia sp. A1-2]